MMHMVCFTCPWATRDKLKAVPISTINLYWNNKCKFIRIHTVRDTLILHFQVLVRPRARVWKHIRAGNNRTLGPITASGKQQRWESEHRPDRRTGQEAKWPLQWKKHAGARTSATPGGAQQWAHRGWWQTPTSSSANYQKRRVMVAQPVPSRRYFFNTSILTKQNARTKPTTVAKNSNCMFYSRHNSMFCSIFMKCSHKTSYLV